MVSSSQSSAAIPVAYQPPEMIPDSQPDPNRFDEDVQLLVSPPKKKTKVPQEPAAEVNEDEDGPPELVQSESEDSEDEEEEKETDQYLTRFQSGKEQVIESPDQKKKRNRVIPKRPSKFPLMISYNSVFSIQKNSC